MKTCERCGHDHDGFDDQCDWCTFPVLDQGQGPEITCPVLSGMTPGRSIARIRFVDHEKFAPDDMPITDQCLAQHARGRDIAERLARYCPETVETGILIGTLSAMWMRYNGHPHIARRLKEAIDAVKEIAGSYLPPEEAKTKP